MLKFTIIRFLEINLKRLIFLTKHGWSILALLCPKNIPAQMLKSFHRA
jgi:hypothetical protein